MLPGALFCATQRLFRQMRHHGLDASPKHIERNGILGKLVRIDQTTAGLVESVGRKAIVDIKLAGGIDSLGVTANQPLHFLLGRLGVRSEEHTSELQSPYD